MNHSALNRCLDTLIERHEVLRTWLQWHDEKLWQSIEPAISMDLACEELPGGDGAFLRRAHELASIPFDIDRPPLLRAQLYHLGADRHGLVLVYHHLSFDGWSFQIFMRELAILYDAFAQERPSPLRPVSLQYVDYAVWQRNWLTGETLDGLKAFWISQLSDAPSVLPLAHDFPRRALSQRGGATIAFTIDRVTSQACRALAQAKDVTPFMLLLAAYQALLYRRTGEPDIIVGAPVANRNRIELGNLIGALVNVLALRTKVDGTQAFSMLLSQVKKIVLAALAQQDMPFELLIETLAPPRQPDNTPLLQAMFTYLNLPKSDWTLPRLDITAHNIANGAAQVDLSLSMWEEDGCFAGQFDYDANLFAADTIQWLVDSWQTLLTSIAAAPNTPVDKLPWLNPTQIRTLLALAKGPLPDYPSHTTIHQLFEDVTATFGSRTALVHGNKQWQYAELNRRANQMANLLFSMGMGRGSLVGVRLPPSPDYVIAVLAVLKTGACYVPLDPSEPSARVATALRGARLALTIGRQAQVDAFDGHDAICVDSVADQLNEYSTNNLGLPSTATDCAYVMFTSGSTGTPKAVCIPHRGVVRLVRAANYAELGATETMLLLAPLAFDASVFELWGALLNGASLVIPDMERPSLSDINRLVTDHAVSTLWLSSALFETLLDSIPLALIGPRQLLVGGEVLSPAHARRYYQLPGAGRLINCYGPTENTTFSTFHIVDTADADGAIPIGRPLAHSAIYVLDKQQQLVPPGVIGEAWLGGNGLFLGYLNAPEATAERLSPHPYIQDMTIYRTGDLVRLRADGCIQYIGRADRQIKLRGYRVEPAEIEALLLNDPDVAQARVLLAGEEACRRLLAYVVPTRPETRTESLSERLLMSLCAQLPEPLRPSHILVVFSLPLTLHGKLDPEVLRRIPVPTETLGNQSVDALEARIATTFAEVLQTEPIGRHEDFFELGGHSLLALKLLARLEKMLAIHLPVMSLFKHSTPARMAAYIRVGQGIKDQTFSGLARIRHGAGPALFLVPGGRGGMAEITLYASVMQHLAHDRQVLGLLADGHSDQNEALPDSVAEMASAYIERIRQVQPHGPYALAGECIGGVVAYEMAQQLQGQGQQVDLLLLIDTWCPGWWRHWHFRWVLQPRQRWKTRSHWLHLAIKDWFRELFRLIRHRPTFHLFRTLRYGKHLVHVQVRLAAAWYHSMVHPEPESVSSDELAARRVGYNYLHQTMSYRPLPSPVPLHLLVSDTSRQLGIDRDWKRLAGHGWHLWIAPGNHETYMRATPEQAAKLLNACLEAALGPIEGT